jgi:DNA-damage-inducible protein J
METIAAMLEAERIAKDTSVKGYTDLDELFADLKK